VGLVEADLRVGEAQRDEAGSDVLLVADSVLRLLRGRAVVAQAVGLDDQA
jgi:F0F1-type ATP synthase beta subunit